MRRLSASITIASGQCSRSSCSNHSSATSRSTCTANARCGRTRASAPCAIAVSMHVRRRKFPPLGEKMSNGAKKHLPSSVGRVKVCMGMTGHPLICPRHTSTMSQARGGWIAVLRVGSRPSCRQCATGTASTTPGYQQTLSTMWSMSTSTYGPTQKSTPGTRGRMPGGFGRPSTLNLVLKTFMQRTRAQNARCFTGSFLVRMSGNAATSCCCCWASCCR